MTPDLSVDLRPSFDLARVHSAIVEAWPEGWGAAPERLSITRVHFSRKRPPVVQYRDEANGVPRVILAEVVGSTARDFAEREAAIIARRGGDAGPFALPDLGLAVRMPGMDAKLPGLALLREPGRAGALLSEHADARIWDRAPEVKLRTHRLSRRAVLEIAPVDRSAPVFARLTPGSRDGGSAAFSLHRRIAECLRRAGALVVPPPLFHDAELCVAVYGAAPGRKLDLTRSDAVQNVAAAMTALRELRAFGPRAVAVHGVEREISVLADWGERVDRHIPRFADARRAAFEAVAEGLSTLPEIEPEPCHRDFHEGQLLVAEDRVGLLDLDTYRLGDPALDPGNLIAHIRLAELRTGRVMRSHVEAVLGGVDAETRERVGVWTRAALLRLGCIYAFSTDDAGNASQLVRDASDGLGGAIDFP